MFSCFSSDKIFRSVVKFDWCTGAESFIIALSPLLLTVELYLEMVGVTASKQREKNNIM